VNAKPALFEMTYRTSARRGWRTRSISKHRVAPIDVDRRVQASGSRSEQATRDRFGAPAPPSKWPKTIDLVAEERDRSQECRRKTGFIDRYFRDTPLGRRSREGRLILTRRPSARSADEAKADLDGEAQPSPSRMGKGQVLGIAPSCPQPTR